jgi:hypothetical protein
MQHNGTDQKKIQRRRTGSFSSFLFVLSLHGMEGMMDDDLCRLAQIVHGCITRIWELKLRQLSNVHVSRAQLQPQAPPRSLEHYIQR